MELPIYASTLPNSYIWFFIPLKLPPQQNQSPNPRMSPKIIDQIWTRKTDTPWIFKDRMWNETETEISVCVEKPTHPGEHLIKITISLW